VSCWIIDGRLSRRSCPMAAQAGGSQGRRERSYLEGTGATEDAARRRAARPSGCEMRGRRPSKSLGHLEDFGEAPALRLRERPRLLRFRAAGRGDRSRCFLWTRLLGRSLAGRRRSVLRDLSCRFLDGLGLRGDGLFGRSGLLRGSLLGDGLFGGSRLLGRRLL